MTDEGRFPPAHGDSMANAPRAVSLADGVSRVQLDAVAETGRPDQTGTAADISRGVARLLMAHDIAIVTELVLPDGRRADVVGVSATGAISIVEIKSSVADFRADHKWADYRAYCDKLYFAVDTTFPVAILPVDAGLILADRYGGAFERAAPEHRLAAVRRKAMILRFGRAAAARLARVIDPALSIDRF